MKKTFLNKKWISGLILLISSLGFSQAKNYSYDQFYANYEPLTNSTVIATASSNSGNTSLDDVNYPNITIPFGFNFSGQTFTSLHINTNGFISFGSAVSGSSPIASGGSANAVISPLAIDLNGMFDFDGKTATIETKLIGDAPNRSFVIQWKHFKPYQNVVASHFDFNFQVHLNEDGTVHFAYDLGVVGTPTGTNAKVGLRGSTSSDWTNRTASGTSTSNWNNTISGTSSSDGIATNSNFLPATGLTITWTTPPPCEAPETQPTTLNLSNTGIIISGNFSPANPVADNYLILRTLSGTVPNNPVDGTVYPIGQNEYLGAYVVSNGSAMTINDNYNTGIRGNNEYVYTIFSANTVCTGGPFYTITEPLTGSIINCPITVNGITATTITSESFQLNWPTNENGTARPFDTIIEVATDNAFVNMVTDSPFTLPSTQASLVVGNLEANKQYFFRGKNTNEECTNGSYSSVNNVYTSCIAVADFNEGFDGVTGLAVPNCWSKILTSASGSTPSINVTTTDALSQPNNVSFYGNGADTDLATTKIILVSPQLNNVASGTHRLRFKARKTTQTNPIILQVVALNANNAAATIEVIGDPITDLTTAYKEFTVYFNNYQGNASYIGIRRIGGSTYSYMYVDDVVWEPVPTCFDLNTVTAAATTDGAIVNWTNLDGAPANGYEYVVSDTNTLPSESVTATPINAESVTITGLASNTTRYFFIRRICLETDKGAWKSVAFTTINTTAIPWTEPFQTASTPSGWATSGFSIGTSIRLPDATGNVIHKNLYAGSGNSGNFTTIAIGLVENGAALTFNYKLANWTIANGVYPPPALNSGNFVVSVSTDFGATFTAVQTVGNNGVAGWQDFSYDLSAYEGEFVQIRITGNQTSGDYVLGFDNFAISEGNLGTGGFERKTVKIYPNPANDHFNIESDDEITEISIFDLTGKTVYTQKKASNSVTIGNLQNGVYIVKLTSGERVYSQKLIKK